MKWFGALLIAVAGVGIGWYLARRLFRRVEWLDGVMAMLDVLADRVRFSAAPLVVLWEGLAQEENTARLPLVSEVADGLRRELSFEESVLSAMESQAVQGFLLLPEREALRLFAASSGRSGLAQQCEQIRRCRETLERVREAAATTASSQAPIVRMAGFAGGVCLALLLL